MTTTQPYEILMRRNGQSWALQARSLTTLDDGTAIEGKAVPLAGLSDPAFAEVAELVGASKDNEIATLTAERDSLTQQLADMTTERDTALSEKASLQAQLDSANASLESANATIETLTSDKAALETANAELQTSVSAITAERDSAVSELASANERIAELTAVAERPVATLSQIRVWLLQTLGVNAIKQVDAMIAAIPDELERAIAYQQWEYANNVLRDNPFVLLIAQQLNLTSEQMDEAYLAATRIV